MASPGYDLYGAVDQGALSSYLTSNGVPLASANATAATMQNLGQAAFSSLQNLSKPNQSVGSLLGDATPLIAAGLAVTAVDPIVGAAVLAGIGIAEGIADLLWPPAAAQTCLYVVQMVCFNGNKAAGPKDPNWITIDTFSKAGAYAHFGDISWAIQQGAESNAGSPWPYLAFNDSSNNAHWWDRVASELWALGERSAVAMTFDAEQRWYLAPAISNGLNYSSDTDDRVVAARNYMATVPATGRAFYTAFDHAFVKMQEPQINGFVPMRTDVIVNAIVNTWNAGYSSSQTAVITPPATAAQAKTFFEFVLAGGFDGQRLDPATINIGPLNAQFAKP